MKLFEHIVGKEENAGNQHFLLSHNIFYHFQNKFLFFSITFILLFTNAFNLDQSKNLLLG